MPHTGRTKKEIEIVERQKEVISRGVTFFFSKSTSFHDVALYD